MSELTDLEICKRIAEIENPEGLVSLSNGMPAIDTGLFWLAKYDPLTDDALCFGLMVKYEVNINRYYDSATISSDYTDRPDIASVSFSTDGVSINKAICLAIIEANKESKND